MSFPALFTPASDERRFRSCSAGAVIDYVSFSGDCPFGARMFTGTLKRHDGGFTVHDPSPSDLGALALCPLVRLEVSVDFRSRLGSDDARADLEAAYRFIARRVWPFSADNNAVARGYRVSKARRVAHRPTVLDESGVSTGEPRLPEVPEVLYVGHTENFIPWQAVDLCDWAQLRGYCKTQDQGRALPMHKQSFRLEVIVGRKGLDHLGIVSSGDLLGLRFRSKFAPFLKMLRPDAVRDKPERRLKPTKTALARRIARHAGALARPLVREQVDDAGLLSLIGSERWTVDPKAKDAASNLKIGTALDNLSRRYAVRT